MNYRRRFAVDASDGVAWINLAAGLWLVASPWIYGFAGTAGRTALNSIIVGIVIAVVAAVRLIGGTRAAEIGWINVILGAWMIASPFVYAYTGDTARTANSIVVGIIVAIVALAGAPAETAAGYGYGAGWGTEYPPMWVYPPYAAFGWPYRSERWSSRSDEGRFRGRGPRGYQRSDAQIRDAVCERMADHPELDASDIDVMVAADGVVTLQGSVADRPSKRLAEDIADSVSGVRDVHNQLRLAGGVGAREMPRRAA
jgi:hypothetical protein